MNCLLRERDLSPALFVYRDMVVTELAPLRGGIGVVVCMDGHYLLYSRAISTHYMVYIGVLCKNLVKNFTNIG